MNDTIETLCKQARAAARRLAHVSTEEKNAALLAVADQVWAEREQILSANTADVSAARADGLNEAMLDRLLLN